MLIERDEEIRQILDNTETIAIVGCSARLGKADNIVPIFLQGMGYRIIPVNPDYHEIFGEKCYASLRDIPDKVDMVNIFTPSREAAGIAEDAIAIGARVFWMQMGIDNRDAAHWASKGGLKVVMNRCMRTEIPRLYNIH